MIKLDWNILFTVINLIILLFILKKFLFSKVLGIIEEREKLIQSKFDEASKTEIDAAALKAHYEDKLAHADNQAEEIIKKSEQEAAIYYKNAVQEAEEKADQLLKEAQKEIEAEKDHFLSEAKKEIIVLASEMAQQIVSKESPYDQFISDVNGKKDE